MAEEIHSARWQKIDDLFQAALDCAPERRGAFLDDSCAGDTALRSEVESLVAAHDTAGFSRVPAFAEGMRLLQDAGDSMAGREIGPYKILRRIGVGGMGAVYLAARADDAFQKEVAIKLIKRGLDTEMVIRRFHGERQIL